MRKRNQPRVNLTGQRFGGLLVLAYMPRQKGKWLCLCKCGTSRIISGVQLRLRGQVSCGCYQREACSVRFLDDLIGRRFGRWIVLSRAPNKARGATRWMCRCDCGTERDVLACILKNGTSQSCGCLLKYVHAATPSRRKLADGIASLNALFGQYKRGAKHRHLQFDLTNKDFISIVGQACHYCHAAPLHPYLRGASASPFVGNGIDRYDGTQGYTLNNCVPCCKRCNFSKNTMHGDEFISFCRSVATNHFALPAINVTALWSTIERVM